MAFWSLLLLMFFFNQCSTQENANASRPVVVNIGSILSIDSIVGRVAKIALEAAVHDVNNDPTILNATKLKLTIHNSNFSGFLSIMEALQFMETESVALIGPQTSVLAHMISHVVNVLQVPLLSFTATDPTLSALQYPFFVRTTHSDLFQMAAIADIIAYYEWKQVAAIYIDDDHGRNGVTALADQLASKRCKISHKAPIKPEATRADISDVLLQIAFMESRVIVVHTYASWGLDILDVGKYLGMMDSGYVWITTDWLSTVIDISSPLPAKSVSAMQGVITLRSYIKDSQLKTKFVTEWQNLTTLGISTYSMYGYDTVWLLARALDNFFNRGGQISFSKDSELKDSPESFLNPDALSIFHGGKLLLENILQVKMNGTTGPIEFTSDKSLVFPAFEVINVIGTGFRRVGYWSNSSLLSTFPPETVSMNRSNSSELLYSVIWPGETAKTPRGWVFPQNGKRLKIGVPNRVSFEEFVQEEKGTDIYSGYCIDVFTSAVNLLPYAVPYKFYSYGDGHKNPSNTDLVSLITAGVYDAAVGDIAIITNRTRMADFTQPFTESGLVVVAPEQLFGFSNIGKMTSFVALLNNRLSQPFGLAFRPYFSPTNRT